MSIRVVVSGARGRVGQTMLAGLPSGADVLGGLDRGHAAPDVLRAGIEVVGGFGREADSAAVARLLAGADVLVDFTRGDAAPDLLMAAVQAGVRPVSGTSGLPTGFLDRLDTAARAAGLGAVWAPNFAIGAALMVHFSRIAARYMDACEVIEMHHDGKADAPSGTAISTAAAIRSSRGSDLPDPPVHKPTLPGARGAVEGGVRIHSIRLPGLIAHQEVLFGSLGQVLTLRHDATGRETYVPGVTLAIHAVMETVGLVRGLDAIMGLQADS